MKKTLLMTLIALTSACSVFAQEQAALRITGPSSWARNTKVTLSIQDKYVNLGGSYGFSYWLQARDTSLLKSVALAHLFSVYSYLWLLAGWRAVFRIVTGRRGWAKTARTAEVASEPPT